MSRKKTSVVDEILALPHTKLIDGKPYVLIVYKDAGGKRREKTRRVNSVAEAISAIEKIRREFGERGPDAFEAERMTFAELLEEYQKARKIPKWYSEPLLEHFGQRKIRSITYGDIERFKTLRADVPKKGTTEKRSPGTINRELEWLRTILLYAVRHEWIARNPFSKGPAPLIRKSEEEPRHRAPSPEEEARILEYCMDFKEWIEEKREARGMTPAELAAAVGLDILDRIERERSDKLKDHEIRSVADVLGASPSMAIAIARGKRDHLRSILIAAKDTGLRHGALLSLTWSQVDLPERLLHIPKGPWNKRRPPVIALSARLTAELSKLWEKSDKKPETKIFGGIGSVKRSYGTACRLAGVTDLHFHDWRHGHATDLLEAGVEERLAMRALGHTSAETHAIYTNVDERLARQIAAKLDELHARRRGGESGNPAEPNEFIN